jgi:hypothetical protein
VGFLDPGELGFLPAGEVLRVLPQRVAGVLEVPGVAGGQADGPAAVPDRGGGPGLAGCAPDFAADFVQGAGGPGDDVERVGAQDCLRRGGGDGPGDPVRAVGGQVVSSPQRSSPSWPEKACTVLASRPGAAQTSSPVS